jgi:hypothetical protein
MRSERRGELHRHVTLVSGAHEAPPLGVAAMVRPAGAGVSLLRLSVPARLVIVAAAAALLWLSVLWALT